MRVPVPSDNYGGLSATKTGLIYTYSRPEDPSGNQGYFWTAIDYETGMLEWATQFTEGDVFTIPTMVSDDKALVVYYFNESDGPRYIGGVPTPFRQGEGTSADTTRVRDASRRQNPICRLKRERTSSTLPRPTSRRPACQMVDALRRSETAA